ncbi:hypothetical protein Q671_12630 [Halomonas sp. PBN3]|nr:hypothetical protein Q671_12630 [Halomonas sp. PBN3]
MKGLCQVIISTFFKTYDLIFPGISSSQNQNRKVVSIFTPLLEQIQPRAVWKTEIEDYQFIVLGCHK